MTKTIPLQRGRPPTKGPSWSREKIAHLISLYRGHECLWNCYNEGYKSKKIRSKAVMDICNKLRVDRYDYGRKIHNLRNQYNSEMKKMNRRLEEANVDTTKSDNTTIRCRWEHFDALSFLKYVIEPRPGGKWSKSIRDQLTSFKTDYDDDYTFENSDDDGKSYVEIETFDSEAPANSPNTEGNSTNIDNRDAGTTVVITAAENINNNTAVLTSPGTTTTTTLYTTSIECSQASQQQQPEPGNELAKQEQIQHLPENCSIMEFASISQPNPNADKQSYSNAKRDQWDAFGELVANEFRNLNSTTSRKKLKRKILQAMLDVGEEDDA